MKKSKLIVAMVLGFLSVNSIANAQDGRFSLGLELGLPMGDFADASSMGIGGSLRYEHPMGDNLGLTITAGYLSFAGKTVDGFDLPSSGMIPAQIGAKYYFTENQNGFYAGVELGVHSSSYTQDAIEFGGVVIQEEETVTNTDFSYAPEIGYHLANIDLGLRYQMIATEGETTSYLGIRAAYVFGGN